MGTYRMTVRFGLPIIVGIVLVVSGVANGLRTDRWGHHPDAIAAADKLNSYSTTIGSWSSVDVPIDDRQLTMAGAMGFISRKYVSQEDGQTVNVMVLCGRHGRISVHSPTVCFVGAGWNLVSTPIKYSLSTGAPPKDHEFWLADFQRNSSGVSYKLRTFWSWSDSGNWTAADHPRIQFAGSPYLFKIYVTYLVSDENEPVEDSSCVHFIKQLVTDLDNNLFKNIPN